MLVIYTDDKLTADFRLSEFSCANIAYLSPDFITFVREVVQPFRTWYNRPIKINSGYRTLVHNKKVGGDSNSLHLTAMAIDFNIPPVAGQRAVEFFGNVKSKWFELCKAAGGYGQMTVHDGWLHLGMSFNKEYYDDRRVKK